MKHLYPIIGISCGFNADGDYFLRRQYCDAVARAGGVPVILPPVRSEVEVAENVIGSIDGLLLSGGGDIEPERFGVYDYDASLVGEPSPERDAYELALARRAYEYDLPTLGICRGIQTIAVALGGSLHLDIPNHKQSLPRPEPSHEIAIAPDSRLARLMDTTENETGQFDRVNSFHHQAVDRVPDGFVVTARSPDNIIEAIESPNRRFYVGVQWHPEHMTSPLALRLIDALAKAAAER
ncbi:MAG TPA: gamma-glutamyl-gamma-aminobutyrate hydrolase family protein [Firmicutes bacterium]|nr:gamma-glutamyl-gamma-aminobutyrate hydrolase family protein [Bacillota bacterium]